MANTVDGYLSALSHARKPEIEQLRAIILASDDGLSEHVKWNAPSFRARGDDRVTMRLHPGDRVQLVFHRGVQRMDAAGFVFHDPTGLIDWAAPDRGTLTITDAAMLDARATDITDLVRRWVAATSP